LDVVTTDSWANVAYLTVLFAVLALFGVAGIYLFQVERAGVLGLIGFICFELFFLLPIAFSFAEATILPLVAADAPAFVENFLGLFNGEGTDGSMGALETIPSVAGALYLAGGLLLGIAIFRARVLERWAGALLAVGAAIAPLAGVVPHEVGRFAAIPVGLALMWLGYSLWSRSDNAPARTGIGDTSRSGSAI
jgi:hypothetical protein